MLKTSLLFVMGFGSWLTNNLFAAQSHAQRGFAKVSGLLASLLASIGLMAISIQAHAVSLLPTGALDTVGTDAIDTVKDITAEMLPWVVGIATAWSVVTFVKKGFGKAGVR